MILVHACAQRDKEERLQPRKVDVMDGSECCLTRRDTVKSSSERCAISQVELGRLCIVSN